MKKIFTLLALCLTTLASFAQNVVTKLTDGSSYYISVGSSKVGYVTAGEDRSACTAERATAERVSKQTWTAHAVADAENTWTFTADVDGTTWYMYTDATASRIFAGTDPGDNFQNYVVTFKTDDPQTQSASLQMLADIPENGQAYANIWAGQKLGHQFGPYTASDGGSQVYFFDSGSVEVPTWNFAFNTYEPGNNDSRYFIEFNRDRSTNTSQDFGPRGDGGLTLGNLVLSCNGDTLVSDSVIAGDANFASKIWHINEFNAETHQIVLQNEAGQYITYKDLAATVPGGNQMFKYVEETGEYVRTGNSGGTDLTAAWMATTNKDEAVTVYVMKSNQGSECYAIGDQADGNNFINAWGNVGWHHFMGKWSVDDPNCALKFVPITEVLSPDQIPADPTTGIKTITPATKVANSTVYTLDGRVAGKSLNGLAKGVYIVNGKKVVK